MNEPAVIDAALVRYPFMLRAGVMVFLYLPSRGLTDADVMRITKFLHTIVIGDSHE